MINLDSKFHFGEPMSILLTRIAICITFLFFLSSCGSNPEITKNQEELTQTPNFVKGSIVSEMLEQARQDYMSALEIIENGSVDSIVAFFESALKNINNKEGEMD